MKRIGTLAVALLLLAGFAVAAVAQADARMDLRIQRERDADRNLVWYLENVGTKRIKARVELTKVCAGQSNDRKPVVRTHYVSPRERVKLGRAWGQTSCDRKYRVVEATRI